MTEVSKAVIKDGERYLLLKRSKDARVFPGVWDFPGGKNEPGENPQEALVRELKEEISLKIVSGPEIHTKEYKDERYHLNFHYFTPEIKSGDLKLSSDHSEYKWLFEEETKNLELFPAVELFLND
jgi:8-oxo-dGTP diphosphatase